MSDHEEMMDWLDDMRDAGVIVLKVAVPLFVILLLWALA